MIIGIFSAYLIKIIGGLFSAKNIYRVLFKNKLPQKNEMFTPGRMAYVVDLEDDFPESDIPTTAIRSKVSSSCI